MSQSLTKEFVAERDLRVFKMRQAGVDPAEIGRRMGMSTHAVNAAVRRQLEKLNREALLAYPEVLRLELERLDALQQAIWPLTQHRKVTLDDGTEVTVEPDLKAVQQVLSVMDRRSRLLGMEATNINVQVGGGTAPERAVLADAAADDSPAMQHNPESEARALLELMEASGVLPDGTHALLPADPEITDAEIVDESPDDA